MISANQALERLQKGNDRFVAGERSTARFSLPGVATKQQPFAIVLGCSDSRVPVEIIFDQGLGDLFVIRVAGNIVAPSQVASVEFAATRFGTRLVVVLGHSRCGAIEATLEELQQSRQSSSLRSLVDRIRPSVETVLSTENLHDIDTLTDLAARANVDASVRSLEQDSEVLQGLIQNDGLVILGAGYSLEKGTVEFFDRQATIG